MMQHAEGLSARARWRSTPGFELFSWMCRVIRPHVATRS